LPPSIESAAQTLAALEKLNLAMRSLLDCDSHNQVLVQQGVSIAEDYSKICDALRTGQWQAALDLTRQVSASMIEMLELSKKIREDILKTGREIDKAISHLASSVNHQVATVLLEAAANPPQST
jgi:hypothetical protein